MAKPPYQFGTERFSQYFESRFERKGEDECWPWTAKSKTRGYGTIGVNFTKMYATHASLIQAGFDRPEGAHALHSCDNKICVNPNHLRWSDNATNVAEAVDRGLMHRGSRTGGAKLNKEAVAAIKESTLPQGVLAKTYGVHPSTISYVKSGRSWKYE